MPENDDLPALVGELRRLRESMTQRVERRRLAEHLARPAWQRPAIQVLRWAAARLGYRLP